MHTFSEQKLIVTDLDGTLLNSAGRVSDEDYKTLVRLGDMGVVRAIATGRSPFSFDKALPHDFPIDYLIFSSGAGTMSWQKKEIEYTTELNSTEVQNVVNELMSHGVDFMVHEPIPTNHRFLFHQSGSENPDFVRRLELYKQFSQPYIPGIPYESSATQILAILPYDVSWFESLKKRFPALKVIRATSPLDGESIWMEIFCRDVSKAYGISWLCNKYSINSDNVTTIGNDFNDLDMLCQYKKSFVVKNAPIELKNKFKTVKSNESSGFSDAIWRTIG